MTDQPAQTTVTAPDADAQPTRFAVLLVDHADPERPTWSSYTPEEQQVVMQRHADFDRAVAATPGCRMVAGEALAGAGDAHVFRRQGGRTVVTEGCYAEAVEQIGGLYLIDAPDLDTLVGLLEGLPDYVMEIRPTASE